MRVHWWIHSGVWICPSLSIFAHAGALYLVVIRRIHLAMRPPVRSHTLPRQAPIISFISGIAVSSRIPVPAHACARFIARAQAPPSRASLAWLRLWSFVTWNRLPGFCITRISAAGDGDGSSLPGPRQLLVTAYSDLILVRRFMQGPIDSPSVIHTFIHGGSRPNHAARAPTATQMHLTRLASMRIRLAESRSALGQGSLFAAVSRRCQSAHLPSWGLSSVSRAARSGVFRCSSI